MKKITFCILSAGIFLSGSPAVARVELPREPAPPLNRDLSAWSPVTESLDAVEIAATAHDVVHGSHGDRSGSIATPIKSSGEILGLDIARSSRLPDDQVRLALGPDEWIVTTDEYIMRRVAVRNRSFEWAVFFRQILPGARTDFHSADTTYLPEQGLFVAVALGFSSETQMSHLFIGLARAGQVNGSWTLHRLDLPFTSSRQISADADAFGLYVTAHAGSFENGSRLWIFGPSIFDGDAGPVHTVVPQWPGSSEGIRHLQTVKAHTVSSEGATFFVATRPGGGRQMAILKMQGNRPSDVTLSRTLIDVPECTPIGGQVEQPGHALRFNGGDCSIADAVYAYRRIYATWTHDASETGARSGIQTVRVNTDSGELLSQDFLDNGPGRRWYYFNPALTVLGGDGPDLTIGLFFNYTQRDYRYISAGAQIFGVDGDDRFVNLHRGDQDWTVPELTGGAAWARSSGAAYDWQEPGVMWGAVQVAVDDEWKVLVYKVAMDGRPQVGGETCLNRTGHVCLLQDRFQVRVRWRDVSGAEGTGEPVYPSTDQSSNFWFFDRDNWEMLIKMLDGCSINGHYWFFGAASTDLGYTITVTDTKTGRNVAYTNPVGTAAAAITDAQALPCD